MFGSILVFLHLRCRRPRPCLVGDNGTCATAMDLPSRAILVRAKWKESFYGQHFFFLFYLSSPHRRLSSLSFYFFLFLSFSLPFFFFLYFPLSLHFYLFISHSLFSILPTFLFIPISFFLSLYPLNLSNYIIPPLSRSLIISHSLQSTVD